MKEKSFNHESDDIRKRYLQQADMLHDKGFFININDLELAERLYNEAYKNNKD